MLVLDLTQLNTYFTIALPVIVSIIAGIIRQDRFPQWVNELISILVVLIIAFLQALFGGKLGGSALADFGIIVAYTMAVLHTPLFQQLQQATQSVTSFGKPASKPAATLPTIPQINLDAAGVTALLLQHLDISKLAALLIAELGKPSVPASAPPPVLPIESMPTQTNLQAIRTSTPPVQGG